VQDQKSTTKGTILEAGKMMVKFLFLNEIIKRVAVFCKVEVIT
jgi:hypothetical protein